MSELADVLKVLVIVVALPLNWWVTWKLWQTAHANGGVLRASFWVFLALSLIITVFALVFINNDLPNPILTGDQTRVITRAAMLGLSVPPAIYLLRLYRRAKP